MWSCFAYYTHLSTYPFISCVSMPIRLSIYVSIHLSFYVSIYLSIHFTTYLSISIHGAIYLIRLSIYLSLVHLPLWSHPSSYLIIDIQLPSIYPSIWLAMYLSGFPSYYHKVSIYLSIYLCMYLFLHVSIYQYHSLHIQVFINCLSQWCYISV